jgi:hypothetical protein
MTRLTLLVAAPMLILSACGGDGGGESPAAEGDATTATEVSINAENAAKEGGDSAVSISASSSASSISIKGDGVDINAKVPGIDLGEIKSDFDIDGVGLYPGATITSMNVNATSSSDAGGSGVVKFGFTAPDGAEKVAAWYAAAFAKAGSKIARKGNRITGTTKGGDAFAVDVAPAGKTSKGVITISG